MTLPRTRLIVSAAVFAANLALSLSYGTAAEAQAPRHSAGQMSRQHHTILTAPSVGSAGAASVTMKPQNSPNPSCDSPVFCDFSGDNPG
jgi:hypothetical protein